MSINSEKDLQLLKRIGLIVSQVLKEMRQQAKAGMNTKELDEIGAKLLAKKGARSAPKITYDFPGSTCISVNEEVAHGIPSKRILAAGDLVNIDVSAELDGYFADTGASFQIPPYNTVTQRLLRVTRTALDRAVNTARAGVKINQIGRVVQEVAQNGGYTVIRNLGGHGVGSALHEEPRFIANYFDTKDERVLEDGMVITIEPFVSMRGIHVIEQSDGWTLKTPDKSLVAQFEHTLVIRKGSPVLITEL
ncbi:MAG: type I methionyl aminopeptidase [Leptospiraceae bacterium]|nr:type I methionyl aminopeptidase [Leptospiraceae bacterium]